MKRKLYILFIFSILLFTGITHRIFSQEQSEMVKYTPDFRFKDGIYLSFDQVRLNDPIPKAKILTSADYNDREFFDKVFATDNIYFYDNMGLRQAISKENVWGFSRNGVLYIQVQNNFSRITFVGSICHFVADITTYDNRYSPYGYYDPYYSPYGYNSYYSPYGSNYSPFSQTSVARNEIKQYMIDFETGDRLEYNTENVEILLMKDPELYDEFVQLSSKKKKEQLFVYVRKFNEKNPVFIPVKQ